MSATVRPVDPVGDLDVLTGWVTAERAAFWGMQGLDREQVGEIYRYIDEQEHLAAYLVLLEGSPVGLLQTYDPEVDEIGEWYDRRPGDLGIHLLFADDPRRAGRTPEVLAACFGFLLRQPGCRRLVLEPDARNHRSIALMERLGAERGPLVDLRTSIAEKPAQFFFISAELAAQLAAWQPEPAVREPVRNC